MAEAFPSTILDSVLKQLESPIFRRNQLSCCLGLQFRNLRSKLELIGAVIHDAELMGILFPRFFREWLCNLRCLLHELDDLLDEALTRSMPQPGMVEKVRLRLRNLHFDLTLARKMKHVDERLEGILKECYKCNLLVERGPPQPSIIGGESKKPIARRGILRYVPDDYAGDDEPEMIGRDDEKEKIIEKLFNTHPLSAIVSIDGEAGVGKTTFCRAVYNDEKVIGHFEVRMWFGLEVIKECLPIDLWKKMITILDEARPQLDNEEEEEEEDRLISKIVRLVGSTRKCLLVLDGYLPWARDSTPFGDGTLDRLRQLNVRTCGGIKTLMIWRFGHVYLNNDLSEEHRWSIFKNAALVSGRDWEKQIEDLGRQIVSRCPGNPALLRGVGTLLHGKESENDRDTWEYFATKFDFEGQYRRYATISSTPYLFHQSVGYLSLFSESELKYEALLEQFAANGFTNFSYKTRLMLENIFLEPIKENGDWDDAGKFNFKKCHGEVIMQLAGADSTSLGSKQIVLPKAARHVSIVRPSDQQQRENIVLTDRLTDDAIHRRSLLFLGKWHPIKMSEQTLGSLASNLLYLRVLDLQDLALKELPNLIGKLIHLTYLDLSRNDFKVLPGSVCKLKNLRTLRLVYCDKLFTLPGRIQSLGHLKHLEINMCLDLTHLPSKMEKLTCLQKLDRFLVGPRKGGLRYLEHLDSLHGHLTIELPRRWEKSAEDAEKANLQRKDGLTSLDFKWQGTNNGEEGNDDYVVLKKLEPHTRIKNLIIINFAGKVFPSWITSLKCLTQITISHCTMCETLPPFHVFPELKYLTLTSMMNIRYLQDDGGSSSGETPCVVHFSATRLFPSLSEIRIGRMPRLIGWSRDSCGPPPRTEHMYVMEVWKCPRLTVMPFLNTETMNTVAGTIILQDVSKKMLESIDWHHQRVKIISVQDMGSLPDKFVANFPAYLEINDCNRWHTFWANEGKQTLDDSLSFGFEFLYHLSIHNCRELKQMSCGLRNLTYLREMIISRCSEELDCLHEEHEDGMPWKALKRLSTLEIEGFQNLEAIPKGFQHLPVLEDLTIVDCMSLKRGMDRLPKLKRLRIKSCPGFITELKREHPDVVMNGEEMDTKWPPRSETSTRIEESIASTSQITRAPSP